MLHRGMSFRLGSVVVVLGLVSVGCGLRSDPLFQFETDSGSNSATDTSGSDTDSSGELPAVVEGRLGSCTNPIDLPATDSRAMGSLRGPGLYGDGQCGADSGLEDVYRFVSPTATDVTVIFDPAATTLRPTVRVLEADCFDGLRRACNDRYLAGSIADPRHFLAFGGREYFIHVDSGSAGDYAFEIVLGAPALQQCDPHSETILQQPGSIFRWENTFTAGQGRVDSQCGGIGREDMFPLQVSQPGVVLVSARGVDGFRPLLSLRRDCSAISENGLGCSSELTNSTPGFAFLELFIQEPGLYFLSVDSISMDAGTYELEVSFN